jgi:hypothetical protein
MKLILTLIMSASLAGCFGTIPPVEPNTVIKFKYIVNTIPGDLLTVPPYVQPLPETANDQDIANWLLDGEKRSLEVESKLKAIKKLQDDRLKELEKLPKEDVIVK